MTADRSAPPDWADLILRWRRYRAQSPDGPLGPCLSAAIPPVRLLELACLDLGAQLQRDPATRVERYLAEFPELREADCLLDLVDVELCGRDARGNAPTLEECLERFPQLDSQLRRMFAVHLWEGQAPHGAPAAPAAPLGGPLVPDSFREAALIRSAGSRRWLRAYDAAGRRVALCLDQPSSNPTDAQLNEFQRRIDAASQLEVPGLPRLREAGWQSGVYYYAADWVSGLWLPDRLTSGLSGERAVRQVMTLTVAADHGRRSRSPLNLAPEWILIDHQDAPHAVDWGLSQDLGGPPRRSSETRVRTNGAAGERHLRLAIAKLLEAYLNSEGVEWTSTLSHHVRRVQRNCEAARQGPERASLQSVVEDLARALSGKAPRSRSNSHRQP